MLFYLYSRRMVHCFILFLAFYWGQHWDPSGPFVYYRTQICLFQRASVEIQLYWLNQVTKMLDVPEKKRKKLFFMFLSKKMFIQSIFIWIKPGASLATIST